MSKERQRERKRNQAKREKAKRLASREREQREALDRDNMAMQALFAAMGLQHLQGKARA